MPSRFAALSGSALLAFLCLIPTSPATGSDRKDFEKAQKIDTIEAYKSYLTGNLKYDSRYVPLARDRLDELIYEQVRSVDSLEAWNAYLEHRPTRPENPGWTERGKLAQAAVARIQVEAVTAAQRLALATPTWANFDAFWTRYENSYAPAVVAVLPQLRFELVETLGFPAALERYEKFYPGTELSKRLRHSLTYRPFEQEPNLYTALYYLRTYPDGEHSAGLRRWVEKDQSVVRAGDLRVEWLDGQTFDSMTVATGEMLFTQGNLKPIYQKKLPKHGAFLVAAFGVYNLGSPGQLGAAQVWLSDGKGQRHVATEVANDDRILESLGLEIMTLGGSSAGLREIYSRVRAVFDLPPGGHSTLRLYVNGIPTLRIAEMPARRR